MNPLLSPDNAVLLGIDPGKTGAIAARMPDGEVRCEALITDPLIAMLGQLRRWKPSKQYPRVFAYLEDCGRGRAKKMAGGADFSRHNGALEMALVACGIPYRLVPPATWMHSLVPDRPRSLDQYAQRKRYIRDTVEQLYPDFRVNLKNADALGILLFHVEQRRRG